MEEKNTPLQQIAGCGCLLILVVAAAAWLIEETLGYMVLAAGFALCMIIGSFWNSVNAEDPDVRRGSGCLSFLSLIGAGFLMYKYLPEKMWIFYVGCVIYVLAILWGINFRQQRLERGKQAAQNFKNQLESQGIDLDNLDE